MKIDNIVSQNLDEKSARPALFVLGMHRSGTSAITGALRHSGVWVGEETELTDANVENPLGFWERRDIRDLCDQMLHSAGADWWKVASFEPKAIPRTALAEQRRKFEKIVSELDKYQAWVIKEPRLCLLLPILRHYVKNLVCIHIHRNPLEVARSLQTRNGFSISAGLALWEVYNLHALKASEGLPRISLTYESIMQHPVETLNALVKELDGFGGGHPIKPDSGLIERFIDLDLYHQRATDEETEDYLLPSQHALWLRLRSGEAFDGDLNIPVAEATKQALFDLESVEVSFNLHNDRANELSATLETRDERVEALEASVGLLRNNLEARDERIGTLEDSRTRLKGSLEERAATLKVRDERIKALEDSRARLMSNLEQRTATLKTRDERISALEASVGLLRSSLEARDERISALEASVGLLRSSLEARDERISALEASVGLLRSSLEARDERISTLEASVDLYRSNLEERTATLKARDERISALEASVDLYRSNLEERTATLKARDERISALEASVGLLRSSLEARDERISTLEASVDLYRSNLEERTATLKARDERISALEASVGLLRSSLEARDERISTLEASVDLYRSNLEERTATLKARDERVSALEGSLSLYRINLEKRNATLKLRDKRLSDLYNSTSWKITAPLRSLSRCIRWLLRNLRRAIKLLFWLGTGQFSRAIEAVRQRTGKVRQENRSAPGSRAA